MRIRKSTYRYIEQEIYDYQKGKRLYEEITKNIIFATSEKPEIKSTDISDPTFNTASMLISDKIRTRIGINLEAIDVAFSGIEEVKAKVLKDKYWHRPYLTWTTIAELHFMDRRTLYTWRTSLVMDIAQSLGLN